MELGRVSFAGLGGVGQPLSPEECSAFLEAVMGELHVQRNQDGFADAASAGQWLSRLMTDLESIAERYACRLKSVGTIFHLRSAYNLASAEEFRRMTMARARAEQILARVGQPGGQTVRNLTIAGSRTLQELMVLCLAVESCAEAMMLLGAGADVSTDDRGLPRLSIATEHRHCWGLYLRRLESQSRFDLGLGGTLLVTPSSELGRYDDNSMLVPSRVRNPIGLRHDPKSVLGRLSNGEIRFEFPSYHFEPLINFVRDRSRRNDNAAVDVLLMLFLLRRLNGKLYYVASGQDSAWTSNLIRYGFSTISRKSLLQQMKSAREYNAQWLSEIDPGGLLPTSDQMGGALLGIPGQRSKRYGPPLRQSASAILIDYEAIVHILTSELNPQPPGTTLATMSRGDHFEAQVKKLIKSKSSLSAEAEGAIGKFAGFEVDAVLETQGRLVVIEVKSYPQTPAYDEGDWDTVSRRNQTVLSELVKHRDTRMPKFLERFGGEGERLGRRWVLDWMLVVSSPLLLGPGVGDDMTEFGLPRVSTYEELRAFLVGDSN